MISLKPRNEKGEIVEAPERYALKEWEYLIKGIKGKSLPGDFLTEKSDFNNEVILEQRSQPSLCWEGSLARGFD